MSRVPRDGAYQRRMRIQELKREVDRQLKINGGMFGYNKFVASMQFEMGLTESRIREYLKIYVDMGAIRLEDINNEILVLEAVSEEV